MIVEDIMKNQNTLKDDVLFKLIAKNPDLLKFAIAKAIEKRNFFLANRLLEKFGGSKGASHQSLNKLFKKQTRCRWKEAFWITLVF